jgi:1-acyl-sn-glycerol-3-phosphate acyltransferase
VSERAGRDIANAPVPPLIVRRLVIDPLWVPVAAGLSALLLLVAFVARLVTPGSSQRVYRLARFGSRYVRLDVSMMLACWRQWLRHPLPARDAATWQEEHAALLARTLDQMMIGAERWLGYRVQTVGAVPTLDPRRPLLVLARHAGPGDSFTLVHQLLTEYGCIPRVVLKAALRWDPGLDVILSRLGSHFLPSSSGAGDDRVAAVARLAAGVRAGDALLIFPEGGNWTPRRHRRSVVRLRRAGRLRQARAAQARRHVLPPRPSGTVAALGAAPDADVLVVTHTGLDTLVNPGQMWRAIPLTQRPMRLRVWHHPAASVPRDETAATRWLDEQWAAVNDWIERVAGDD